MSLIHLSHKSFKWIQEMHKTQTQFLKAIIR